MTSFPKPPDWLDEWETESGLTHPEAREPLPHVRCPQCDHGRHYGRCMRAVGEQRCECGPESAA